MDTITKNYKTAAGLFVQATKKEEKAELTKKEASVARFVGAIFAVSSAYLAKDMTYDESGNNGKGSWKGGTVTMKKIMATNAACPDSYTGDLSKAGKVLQFFAVDILGMYDDVQRLEACQTLVQNLDKTLDQAYDEAKEPKEKKAATLTQMVANLLAWAEKNGHDATAVMVEVGQQSGLLDEDGEV